jgi:hypothetical protein
MCCCLLKTKENKRWFFAMPINWVESYVNVHCYQIVDHVLFLLRTGKKVTLLSYGGRCVVVCWKQKQGCILRCPSTEFSSMLLYIAVRLQTMFLLRTGEKVTYCKRCVVVFWKQRKTKGCLLQRPSTESYVNVHCYQIVLLFAEQKVVSCNVHQLSLLYCYSELVNHVCYLCQTDNTV